MSKRFRESQSSDALPAKRARHSPEGPIDRLSSLSDELLLNILSYLPISSLNECQRYAQVLCLLLIATCTDLLSRLSRRFHALSGDSELWKRQYYSQWVRPRARRLARRSSLSYKTQYSPQVSTWLDHSHLAESGKATNWKRQYRLRHNWSKGLCRLTEVELPQPPSPPVLAKLCVGIVFTADAAHGLRAWSAQDPSCCLAMCSFQPHVERSSIVPTALAVCQSLEEHHIVVGFDQGHIESYIFRAQNAELILQSTHSRCGDGAITAMALSSPYLLVVSQHKVLSLYHLRVSSHRIEHADGTAEPRQLASLRADNMVAPMTLSLRVSATDIMATIVYSFYHIGCGWSLGIQELRFNKDGQQVDSRLTSTVDSQYGIKPLQGSSTTVKAGYSVSAQSLGYEAPTTPATPSIVHSQPPTSMSYSHPYLLTSHTDNTLTMYLVVSDSKSLFVRGGQRLWGHTSSVSVVQVTNRGKAISVSSRGNEIRIWELETTLPSMNSQRPLKDDNGIQVNPEHKHQGRPTPHGAHGVIRQEVDDLGLISRSPPELSHLRECVGFDEERVLLLRGENVGTQLLECYDFT